MERSFVKIWSEGIGLNLPRRAPHLNPIEVGTAGMDQVDTASIPPKSYPPGFDQSLLDELAELKRRLTGRPHGSELSEEEREKIRARIEELSQSLNLSPDDADQTYGIKAFPVGEKGALPTADPREINLDKPRVPQEPWSSINH